MADTEELLLTQIAKTGSAINDIIRKIKAKHWRKGYEYLLNTGRPGLLTVNLKNNQTKDPYHIHNSSEKVRRQRDRGEKIRKNAKNNFMSFITFTTEDNEDDIEDVLDLWAPKHNRRMILIEDHFNQKIKFHYTSYNGLVSLHTKILSVVPKYKLFGGSKQAIEILQNYRSNQDWIHQEFQEIELFIRDSPSIAPSIQKEVDDINKELDKIEKRILAVIDRAEDSSATQETNDMRANKIFSRWQLQRSQATQKTSTNAQQKDKVDNLTNSHNGLQSTKTNNNSSMAINKPAKSNNGTINNVAASHQVYSRWAVPDLDLTAVARTPKAAVKIASTNSNSKAAGLKVTATKSSTVAAKHVSGRTAQSTVPRDTAALLTAPGPVPSAASPVLAKVIRTRSKSQVQDSATSTPSVAPKTSAVQSVTRSGVKRKASAADLDSSAEPLRKRK